MEKKKTILFIIAILIILIIFILINLGAFGIFSNSDFINDSNNQFEDKNSENLIDNNLLGEVIINEDINDFVEKILELKEYKIDYLVDYGGEEYETTQYYRNGEFRRDTIQDGHVVSEFFLKNGGYSCSDFSGEIECFSFVDKIELNFDPGFFEIIKNPKNYHNKSEKIESEIILNQKTNCYQIDQVLYETTYCLNEKGAPLYMKGVVSDIPWSFVATNYSSEVLENDFNLPTEPKEFEFPN